MDYWTNRKTVEQASLDISGSNSFEYIPGAPVDILRLGIVITTATTGASPSVITVTKRPTAGSASGAITVGTFSIPSGVAAGLARYVEFGTPSTTAEVAEDGGNRYVATPDILKLDVGESLVVASNGGADAGAGIPFLEILEQPFVGSRISDATKLTFTYS